MGWFKRAVGLDLVDTVVHVGVTLFAAYLGTEVLSPGAADDGAVLSAVFGASLLYFGWRRHQALRNRPPETTGEVAAMRVEELEARLADLAQREVRVAELEERLDFAERLLARQQDAARIAPGGEA